MAGMTTFTRKSRRPTMIVAMGDDIGADAMTALRDRLAPLVPFAASPGRARHGLDALGRPTIVVETGGRRHCMTADAVLKGSSTALAHADGRGSLGILLERTPVPEHCAPMVRAAHMLSITALAHDALDHLLHGHGMPLEVLESAAAAAAIDARRAEGIPEAMTLELTLHSPIRRWTTNPGIARIGDDEPGRCPEAHDPLIAQEVPVIRISLVDGVIRMIPVRGETGPTDDPVVVMRRIVALGEVHAHARRLGLMTP